MKPYWLLIPAVLAFAQTPSFEPGKGEPVNVAPNPYATVSEFFRLPDGRTWGSTSAVEVDKDGKSVWVAERCGANSCRPCNESDPRHPHHFSI